MISALDVQPYLQAILSPARNRQDWQNFYMSTQAQLPLRVRAYASAQSDPEASQQEDKLKQMEVLAGLRKYAANHVLLIGNPGSGKSTALRRLLYEEAERCAQAKREQKQIVQIPVLLELRSYRNGSVLDWLKEELRSLKLSLSQEEIQCFLDSQGLLLLFDGLNELPSRESWREVDSFRKRNPETPMIFTTRKLEAGADLGIEKKLEMMPLSESQMRQFIERRLKGQADELLRGLGNRLQDLAETPLLLKMLCEVFTPEQPVPQNRGGLFRMFVRRYDEEHKPRCQYEANTFPDFFKFRDEVMQLLAVEMIQGGEPPTDALLQIDKNQAEELIETSLRRRGETDSATKAKNWLEDLIEHHLLQLAANSRQIEFHHQLFQEYYAAEWLLLRLKPNHPEHISNEQLKYYLNYLKWTEAIALMLNLEDDEAQAKRVVKLALEVDLMLGARLAGEVKLKFQRRTINLIADYKFPRRWFWSTTRFTKLPKQLTILLLGMTRSESVIPILMEDLKNKDSVVRNRVYISLGEIRSEKSVGLLKEAFSNEHPQALTDKICVFLCAHIIESLGRIGSEKAIPTLIQALNDEFSGIRTYAVGALEQIGSKEAASALAQALNDEERTIRWRVAFASPSKEAISEEIALTLIRTALNDEYPMSSLLLSSILTDIESEVVVSTLIQALGNETSSISQNAIQLLSGIGSASTVEALAQALSSKSPTICKNAIKALVGIGGKEVAQILTQALNHQDSQVRQHAVHALYIVDSGAAFGAYRSLKHESHLGRLIDSEAFQQFQGSISKDTLWDFISGAVIQDLESEDIVAHQHAAHVLVPLDLNWIKANSKSLVSAKLPVTTLIKNLNYPEPFNPQWSFHYWHTIVYLGEIDNEAAVDALVQVLHDDDKDSLTLAIYALGKQAEKGNATAVNALIQALNSVKHAFSAADKLSELDNLTAINALIEASNHENPNIRHAAIDALGKIDNTIVSDQARIRLVKALQDEHPDIRISAAEALFALNATSEFTKNAIEEFIQSLIKNLNHENTCTEAITLLGKIGNPSSLPYLSKLLFKDLLRHDLLVDGISSIQSRCGYYNYDIAKSPPLPSAAVRKIQELLTQLAQTYPTTTKSEQQIFLDQFDERIRPTPHIASILVEGGIEGIKLLCPPAGIPIEMARKLYEILMKNRER